MELTKEEKEALFEEFKNRMRKQRGESCWETFHNMEQSKDYFWDRHYEMRKLFSHENWAYSGVQGGDWDLIRKLVLHANGVCIVKHLPKERLDSANKLAIEISKLLFDYNEDILKDNEINLKQKESEG